MKFLLKLKHWQLFLLTWGAPLMMNIYSFSDPSSIIRFFPFMMILFTLGMFGWIWAIATEMHKRLPSGVFLNIGVFKALFLIPMIYMLGIVSVMGFIFSVGPNNWDKPENIGVIVALTVVLHFFSIVCIFIGLRFAAKAMKSVELGRMARFSDYSGEFFLIWFSPVGIWILQPRLNDLIKGSVQPQHTAGI
jgi:hypothetical protein